MKISTGIAPVNIAVIKYWGKKDEKLILPMNDSISGTLSTDEMHAKTTVSLSPDFIEDKLWLNGKEESVHHPRIAVCLSELRKLALQQKTENVMATWKMHICSENNFPTAAGLASSAAGYSCLVFTVANVLGLDTKKVSHIARQGSGSACRSMFGGFVRWRALSERKQNGSEENEEMLSEESCAEQIITESYWSNMRVIILVVNDQAKSTSSTSGMQRTALTSSLYTSRVQTIVPQRCVSMETALRGRDFESFAELTMKDSNQFHAVCLDTYPPIVYMNETSHAVVRFIHAFNETAGEVKVAYTFDAGPNACLYVLEESVPLLLSTLVQYFPPSKGHAAPYIRGIQYSDTPDPAQLTVFNPQPAGSLQYLISTKIGSGPRILDDNLTNHLLNEQGIPKHPNS